MSILKQALLNTESGLSFLEKEKEICGGNTAVNQSQLKNV